MNTGPLIRKTGIYQELEPLRALVEELTPLFGEDNVISVTSRRGAERPLHDHIGWLPEGVRERDFTVINPEFRGTPVETLLEKLPFAFGRTRIMRMPKKSCLSIHWDTSLRYHYAVITNPACYLIHMEGETGRFYHVPADGYVYEMDARLTHTAINASRHARIHLVVCDAKDENLKDGRPAEHAELLPSR
jgi:hypothetical protein